MPVMEHTLITIRHSGAMLLLFGLFAACGGDSSGKAAGQPAAPETTAAGSNAAAASEDWKPTIRTATLPENLCELIPVAEVEAILGALAEAPQRDNGCRYILPMPESVVAKRQQAKAAREKFGQAFGISSQPEGRGSILDVQEDPRSFSVTVNVDLDARADTRSGEQDDAAKGPNWDEARRQRSGFYGRAGHVRITVTRQSPDVPSEPMYTLAERVRERIPDLPFAVTNPYQVIQVGDGDPCSLLTRAEAEAVLGPLAMDPYRSSSEWPPLAHGKGFACAYFTPGHRVFVLSPTWTGGASSYKIARGVGGLIGIVAPQESLVVRGPWEQAHVHEAGAFMFLKGDRLLEVYYGTSRASRGDAIKLAATAMQRLAP
jgi:hypothetical protein